MNRFLKNTVIFIISFFAFLILTYPILNLIISRNKSIFQFEKSKNILIIGDSHTECGINDLYFPNAVNLSSSGDAYFYSYLKLKKFIKINHQIDTVILGYGYHDLVESMNLWYLGDMYISEKFPKYIYFMNLSEIYSLFKVNSQSVLSSTSEAYRSTIKLAIKSILHFKYNNLGFGKYRALTYNKLEDDILKLMQKNKNNTTQSIISQYQTKYLLKINDLCKMNSIKLILISTPINKYLLDRSIGGKELAYKFYKTHLKENLYMDFSNLTLPDSGFGDCEHLNTDGARYFTKMLKYKFDNNAYVNNINVSSTF